MKTRSKRTYKNISNSTFFNDIVQTLKAQKLKSAFEIKSIQTRSLEHIFCFLSELLFRHLFAFSADKRRQPLLGARGKNHLIKIKFFDPYISKDDFLYVFSVFFVYNKDIQKINHHFLYSS